MTTEKPNKRHNWLKISDYRKRCQDCGLNALRRPHPYGRQWWTEWTTDTGLSWDTLSGDKTPACPPRIDETTVQLRQQG